MSTFTSTPDRRIFLRTAGALAGGAAFGSTASARAADDTADKAVAALYESLSAVQRKAMCFDWDKKGGYGGLPLRLHVTNNWAVSPVKIGDLTALTADQHQNGKHLFLAGRDRVVKAWGLVDGTHLRDFGQGGKGLTESIYSLSISPDGKLLAVADGVGQVVIYSLTGQ